MYTVEIRLTVTFCYPSLFVVRQRQKKKKQTGMRRSWYIRWGAYQAYIYIQKVWNIKRNMQ